MSQLIRVTNEDIAYAEGVLLPEGKTFDENERKTFIRNLETLDLQAVPGSGKTTVLLAKLLILERKLPFDDGAGILVISHTNAAVDEIRSKIQKHCPKLFSYPNFIGTIQRFIDVFLGIPCYTQWKKKKPYRIDNEIYTEQFNFKYPVRLRTSLEKRLGNKYSTFIQEVTVRNNELTHFYTGELKPIPKIGNHTETYLKLVEVKKELLHIGVLNFNDAYTFAKAHIEKFPSVIKLLQKRFGYVFVDEMQDMDEHQYDLLERIFYEEGNSISKYQRIGDKNQSIYNGYAKDKIYWTDREKVLPLSGSHRLTPAIAKVVNNFALLRNEKFEIVGLKEGVLSPRIIKYSDTTIQNVIPKYLSVIKQLQATDAFPKEPKYPIKVIAWNTEWKTEEQSNNPDIVRLVDYYSRFSRAESKIRTDHPSLKGYLYYYDKNKKILESIRDSILNGLLKIIRLEGELNLDGRHFTRRQLLQTIKEKSEIFQNDTYEVFKLNLYNWSIDIIRGESEAVYKSICNYIPEFLAIFKTQIKDSIVFITSNLDVSEKSIDSSVSRNKLKIDELEVEVTSVHSAKGQTHSATLYLESAYRNMHESERLFNQFLGQPFDDKRIRHKESTKISYVGLSRPTNLLCIAIHEDRFSQFLNEINTNDWTIINA